MLCGMSLLGSALREYLRNTEDVCELLSEEQAVAMVNTARLAVDTRAVLCL